MRDHLFWYTARASGIVAWSLLSLAVLWGVILSTRLLGRRTTPAWLLDLHRFLGGTSVAFVVVHVAALVGDSYAHFGPSEILVPLASAWRPVAVAWGVVAAYLLVAVELTSLARKRLPARLWRRVHQTSFATWVLSTVHLFASGSDAKSPILQWVTLVLTVGVVFTVVVRVLSPKPDRPPTRRATPQKESVGLPALDLRLFSSWHSRSYGRGMELEKLFGLPAHPLIVHVPIVLIPLAAAGAVALAFVPRWRSRFGWLLVAITGIALAGVQLAMSSGEGLEEHVEKSRVLERHTDMAESMRPLAIALFLVVLALVWLDRRQRREGDAPASVITSKRFLQGVSAVVIVLSVLTTVRLVQVGHNGAKASWDDVKMDGRERGEGDGDED